MVMMIVVIIRMKTVAQSNHVCKLSSVAVMECVFLVNGDVMASLTAGMIRMKMAAVRMFSFVVRELKQTRRRLQRERHLEM